MSCKYNANGILPKDALYRELSTKRLASCITKSNEVVAADVFLRNYEVSPTVEYSVKESLITTLEKYGGGPGKTAAENTAALALLFQNNVVGYLNKGAYAFDSFTIPFGKELYGIGPNGTIITHDSDIGITMEGATTLQDLSIFYTGSNALTSTNVRVIDQNSKIINVSNSLESTTPLFPAIGVDVTATAPRFVMVDGEFGGLVSAVQLQAGANGSVIQGGKFLGGTGPAIDVFSTNNIFDGIQFFTGNTIGIDFNSTTDNIATGCKSISGGTDFVNLGAASTFISDVNLSVTSLPVRANEGAAADLDTGRIYQTATGEVRIKL